MTQPEGDTVPFRFRRAVEVRFRDIDVMGHAHHSLPLIYFEEARAAYWRDVAGRADVQSVDYIIAEFTVRYHARILFPDTLEVSLRTSRVGTKSFEMDYEVRSGAGELLASGHSVQVMYDYAAQRAKDIPVDVRTRIESYERGPRGL
jgi:acyl-CoA thioester hydrolase